MRVLFWLIIYVCFLGVVSIKVTYRDGLVVHLVGWPDAIMNWIKSMGGVRRCDGKSL